MPHQQAIEASYTTLTEKATNYTGGEAHGPGWKIKLAKDMSVSICGSTTSWLKFEVDGVLTVEVEVDVEVRVEDWRGCWIQCPVSDVSFDVH